MNNLCTFLYDSKSFEFLVLKSFNWLTSITSPHSFPNKSFLCTPVLFRVLLKRVISNFDEDISRSLFKITLGAYHGAFLMGDSINHQIKKWIPCVHQTYWYSAISISKVKKMFYWISLWPYQHDWRRSFWRDNWGRYTLKQLEKCTICCWLIGNWMWS